MDNWFTIEQIDRDTFSISEYKHWEETHCYLLCGEKYASGTSSVLPDGVG